jgi:hypothetical protein
MQSQIARMLFYKLTFCKGYHFSLRKHFANSPENAAGHMHFLLTMLIGTNLFTIISFILLFIKGKDLTKGFLQSGVSWIVIFGLAYGFVYRYFIYKRKYIDLIKTFYNSSKFKGTIGTVIAILYNLVSVILFFVVILIVAK